MNQKTNAMKKAENNNLHIFQGAGYLLGFGLTMVIATVIFIWSENVTVSISAAVPIGTTMGILLEQKFQNGNAQIGEKGVRILISLLAVGIMLFIALFFMVKLA